MSDGRIYRSRFTPGVKGGDICWNVGDMAVFVAATGMRSQVTILSHQVSHKGKPGAHCREVLFPDGSEWCVDADQLEPILGANR